GAGMGGQELSVVLQHLLEVRNHPKIVHRIAREAPAELIEYPALGHSGESERRHVQRFEIRLRGPRRAVPVAQAAFDAARVREFRGPAETAETRIERLLEG